MCGIFGFIAKKDSGVTREFAEKIIHELFLLSESRGKESSGIAIRDTRNHRIQVTKEDVPASDLVRSRGYRQFLDEALAPVFAGNQEAVVTMAHSRLVTNGSQEHNHNNQPVVKDEVVMIHNGIVTNVDELWKLYEGRISRQYEVDTEVLAALFRHYLREGFTPVRAIRQVFAEIEGAASVVVWPADASQVVMATNTGSFYYLSDAAGEALVFASEAYILRSLLEKNEAVKQKFAGQEITWLEPFSGLLIDTAAFSITPFSFENPGQADAIPLAVSPATEIHNAVSARRGAASVAPQVSTGNHKALEAMLEYPVERIKQLKRCSRCLLPETFPFIHYDAAGVCNYCLNYQPKALKTDKRPQFEEILQKYRRNDGKPDCVVAFSGGRDSSYGLHLLKNEFGMTPITFTYDWGMVTDLARRNIARITGKLGVENILISADIRKKRENIRKNVAAWLKKPRLGMIPLFMAGDKHFFVHVNEIRRQTGISCDIWMENKLENTDFKAGFAGIRPDFTKKRIDKQSTWGKIQMPLYYLRNFATNPRYLNSSLGDTFSAYKAYYMEPREVYLLLFDYIPWDEESINRTLIGEYNWELAPDTTSTWRIGDGTAAFYNYIYYTVAGFSEFDTFRSNQIREGMLTREEALEKIYEENRPRYESLKWYLDTIGIDYEQAIRVVNRIPKLYSGK